MVSFAAFDVSQYVRVVSLLQDLVEGFRGRVGVTDPFNLQPPTPTDPLSTNDALDLVCLLGFLLPQIQPMESTGSGVEAMPSVASLRGSGSNGSPCSSTSGTASSGS